MPDTCPECSTSLDADANFCPSCSAPVNPQCPSCGKSIIAGAKFCKYCAFDLEQKAMAATNQRMASISSDQKLESKERAESSLDNVLLHKYQAMTDSHLLMMLKGDLSGQTEKSLSIALSELQKRTVIEWRDMAIAKTRVEEAIVAAHLYGSVSAPRTASRQYASEDLQMEKAERLARAGGITAIISALLFLWGYNYTSSFANSARAGLMSLSGHPDSTYQLASWCVSLGALAFVVGLILFIVGMAQRSS